MSIAVAPTTEISTETEPPRRGHAPFPTPIAPRLRGPTAWLGALPLAVVPVTFLVGFVTMMTFIPSCSGDRVTHRTTVTGVQLVQGRVSDPAATPSSISRVVASASPNAVAVLVAALAALPLVLLVRRFAALLAALGGGAMVVALMELHAHLSDRSHNVDVGAEAGYSTAFIAGLLALVAGLCLHRWRRRELEPQALCAGFWRRLLAFAIDVLLLSLVTGLVAMLVPQVAGFVLLAGLLLYWPLMERSCMQATVGKQALGLVVADRDGLRLAFGAACLRHLLRALSIVTVIGVLVAGWTFRRQGLHDMLMDTHVVRSLDM